jgi:phage-related protein
MTWKVSFYDDEVEKETLALPPSVQANFVHIVEMIEEFGANLGRPHTAPLGQGLFEIRAKGKEGIARSLFCIVKNQEIIILLTAIKKSDKLPKRLMELARKRMKELEK